MKSRGIKAGVFISVMLLICVLSVLLLNEKETEGCETYYTEDYTVIYKDTIDAMFGDDYTVSEPRYCSEKIEKCCEDENHKVHYIVWDITYKNANGEEKVFLLKNIWDFSYCVQHYLEEQIESSYNKMFKEAFSEILLNRSGLNAYVTCRSWNTEKMLKANERYLENLSTPDGCVPLYKLTEKNVFELMPAYIDIHIYLPDSRIEIDGRKIGVETYARLQLSDFIDKLNSLTDNTLNLAVYMNDKRIFFINGEQVNADYYEAAFFKAYEDRFYI